MTRAAINPPFNTRSRAESETHLKRGVIYERSVPPSVPPRRGLPPLSRRSCVRMSISNDLINANARQRDASSPNGRIAPLWKLVAERPPRVFARTRDLVTRLINATNYPARSGCTYGRIIRRCVLFSRKMLATRDERPPVRSLSHAFTPRGISFFLSLFPPLTLSLSVFLSLVTLLTENKPRQRHTAKAKVIKGFKNGMQFIR